MAKIIDRTEQNDIALFSEEEKTISLYVYKNTKDIYSEDYTQLISDDNRFFVKYHFSNQRAAMLRWYPFDKDSRVLEVGAEYGALTGALCDNCRFVTAMTDTIFKAKIIEERYKKRENLDIIAGTYDIIFESKEKYDYIIFFKELEYVANPVEILNKLKNKLSPEGKLLIAVENKYGIQNLCGKKDSHTGIPFDVFSYKGKNEPRCYHKAELEQIFNNSNFESYKFYYPMPDYVAPRAIYTDNIQPGANIVERLVTYDEDSSTYVADDRQYYIDAALNGTYSFMCNSFFVELSNSDNITNIDYVTLSGYRTREKAFAVNVVSDDKCRVVRKKMLYPEAWNYASFLCEQVEVLSKRGLNVLPMKLIGDSIEMDYVDAPTVQQYIEHLTRIENIDKQKIYNIFDRLWENILISSPISEKGRCEFDTKGLDVGPILEKGYLELITLNSFWENDDILYFDQEYVRDNYPARYIMARNIMHSYGMIPRLNDIINRSDMAVRYGITPELEDLFLEVEMRLSKEENPELYFYKSDKSIDKMNKNRMRLLED